MTYLTDDAPSRSTTRQITTLECENSKRTGSCCRDDALQLGLSGQYSCDTSFEPLSDYLRGTRE